MKSAIISIKDLTYNYPGITALDSLTIDIAEGEVFGFLGHNGAGKTTTIHLLTTLAVPSSGSATVAGHDILTAPNQVRRSIGYVPERVRLYDALTARENLRFFAKLSGVEKPDKAIKDTLGILSCPELADIRFGAMSKGMQQRIGLAQAILHMPKVLFLDEPTSGLDPMGVRQLRDLIQRLNQEFGMTIFMNTHVLSEVGRTCTSIGVLSHGRLVFHDTMEAVTRRFGEEGSLEDLYLSFTPSALAGVA